MRRGSSVVAAVLLSSLAASAAAEQVACHYSYGGETRILTARPVASPYTVAPVAVGSYFLFRVVFQDQPAGEAAIKVYTYVDRDGGPAPIHQATYPYPPVADGKSAYGFTGLQYVYEPVRDSELQYWCRLETRS